jgi:hypothetical protein
VNWVELVPKILHAGRTDTKTTTSIFEGCSPGFVGEPAQKEVIKATHRVCDNDSLKLDEIPWALWPLMA